MSLRNILLLLLATLVLHGCAITPSYKIESIDKQFSQNVKTSNPSVAVAQFDAYTPSDAVQAGTAFGALGVLVADAATSHVIETMGIGLQNVTMQQLEKALANGKFQYKSRNLMAGTTAEELSQRFKSNRLWGFSDLDKEQVSAFFQKNPEVEFCIHITSLVFDHSGKLSVKTKWNIYKKDGTSAAKIETNSVKEMTSSLSDDAYFDEIKKLQFRNIREFIKLMDAV